MSDASDQKLLQAVFKQVDLANVKLDFELLAKDLGINTGKDPKGAASKRWSRYKEKSGLVLGKSTKDKSTSIVNAKSNAKSEGNVGDGYQTADKGTNPKSSSKKRKFVKEESEDEEH
ncbi:hypothetical protein SBOR_8170 [Sclerotinia borealis F-4128]|uniref:Myb-like DNA-binding domain-containing protein n=1 Tax=Sclerotinia borealis (strain F-4128) TaxID=1432307 RepID=W9C3X3_SCLBF|nr:hypothetical protein SBOR_8170 [Sclerotinia borealis F-4128]